MCTHARLEGQTKCPTSHSAAKPSSSTAKPPESTPPPPHSQNDSASTTARSPASSADASPATDSSPASSPHSDGQKQQTCSTSSQHQPHNKAPPACRRGAHRQQREEVSMSE